MEFRIPKSAELPLADFLKFSDEEVKRLLDAIRQSKPALLVESFALEVVSISDLDKRTVKDILSMFAGMYLARIDTGRTLDEFILDFSEALQKRTDEKLKPHSWPAFEQNVKAILECEESLGVTAKALDLLRDHEHGLHSVRIITDVRHIFAADPSQRPKAAVIVHTLNLRYHDIEDLKEIYIALDASDLKNQKSAIERAELKERNLKGILKELRLDCLESR